MTPPRKLAPRLQASSRSKASSFVGWLGFTVDIEHRQASPWQFVKWFFWDYKNNLLLQMSRNNWLLGSAVSIHLLRPLLNRWRGARIGKNVTIGDGAIIGLTYTDKVTIGDDCHISANVAIIEHGRQLKGYGPEVASRDLSQIVKRPVVIEQGCCVGVGATILPGVRIGRGSIVEAGTVVRENVPSYSLVVGDPAKVVRTFGVAGEELPCAKDQVRGG